MSGRNWFAPRSLRFQLLSRTLVILSVLLLLIGALQYVFMKQILYSNKVMALQSQMRSIPSDEWQNLINAPSSMAMVLVMPDTTFAIVKKDGSLKMVFNEYHSSPPPHLSNQAYQAAMPSEDHPYPSVGRNTSDYQIVNDPLGNEQLVVLQNMGGTLVQASTSVREMQDVLIRQLSIFLSLAFAALLGGLLTFRPFLHRTLVPLSNMADTVERINDGNLGERLPVEQGQLETDRLAASINGMLERLEQSFAAEKEAQEQMRRFIADASHELRTPLSSIHGFLEVLLRGTATNPDPLQAALQSMHGESERLKKLVEDIQLLARLDRAPTQFQMAEGRLDFLVRGKEAQLRMLADARHLDFPDPLDAKVLIDQDLMKQVVLRLFQNAVQHTDPKQGAISITLEREGNEIVLAVRDNGPGIPEEHLPHLFERFSRIDTARARKSGGSGLGLAITKSIVEIHGGTIDCQSKPGEGTVFLVKLPVSTP